jgi:hypothetical protein
MTRGSAQSESEELESHLEIRGSAKRAALREGDRERFHATSRRVR